MTATVNGNQAVSFSSPYGTESWEQELLQTARADGLALRQFETDTGQLVWAWQRRNDPGPRFLSRRLALSWMADWLERGVRHDL